MKKVTKFLAVLLALVLVIGAIPVSAASTDVKLKKEKKTLYLGGCKGTKSNGKKAKFYEYLSVKKIVENYDSKTMEFVLEVNEDKGKLNTGEVTTNNSKGRITAKAVGTVYVTVTVRKKSTQKPLLSRDVKITVNKNADKDFTVKGIKDGGEYEVGEKLTVTMARSNDTDYRELLSDDAGVTLTKKTTKGTKYVVNFEKAGTYTIKARTYQSNTYKGTTAEKTFKVTVTGGAEPTTTPEPTPTPTTEPTATPTPTEAPVGDLAIKQTKLNAFVVSGVKDAASIKAADITVYTKLAGTETEAPFGAIKDVSAKENDLTVQMYSTFDAEQTYYVKIAGVTEKALTFKAANYRKEDIAKIGITNTKVLYNQMADLGIRYYNADGVDITEKVESIIPVVTLSPSSNITDAFVSGNQVYFMAPDKTCVFEISITKGLTEYGEAITLKNEFAVTSFEPKSSGLIYTVTNDDGVYLKKDDKLGTSFAYKDSAVIEALFVYDDGSVKTLDQEGVDYVTTSNPDVLFIGTKCPTGGYYLIANNAGESTVLFYKGGANGKFVGSAKVTVNPEKKPVAIDAKVSKVNLNVNPLVGDTLEITATVKDQYGNALTGQPITITQTDGTKTVTGIASFGGFIDGKLTVKGSDIVLNSGVPGGAIMATVSSGSLSATVTFTVANQDKPNLWKVNSVPEAKNIQLNTGILAGDAKPSVATMSVEGMNLQYFVRTENLKMLGKNPTPAMKASEFGIATGETAYFYTITKDGKLLESVTGTLITNVGGKLTFQAFGVNEKLEAGNYLVMFYSVTGGDTTSNVSILDSRSITVVDNQPAPVINRKAEKSANPSDIDAFNECYEIIIGEKALEASAVKAVNVHKDTEGRRFFESVTILIHNDIYGDFIKEYSIPNSIGLIK